MASELYTRFPSEAESSLHERRARIVNNSVLGAAADAMGLTKHVLRDAAATEPPASDKWRADCFEALLCAVYLGASPSPAHAAEPDCAATLPNSTATANGGGGGGGGDGGGGGFDVLRFVVHSRLLMLSVVEAPSTAAALSGTQPSPCQGDGQVPPGVAVIHLDTAPFRSWRSEEQTPTDAPAGLSRPANVSCIESTRRLVGAASLDQATAESSASGAHLPAGRGGAQGEAPLDGSRLQLHEGLQPERPRKKPRVEGKHPKSALQEALACRSLPPPEYVTVDHRPVRVAVECWVCGQPAGHGVGVDFKAASAEAATQALAKLESLPQATAASTAAATAASTAAATAASTAAATAAATVTVAPAADSGALQGAEGGRHPKALLNELVHAHRQALGGEASYDFDDQGPPVVARYTASVRLGTRIVASARGSNKKAASTAAAAEAYAVLAAELGIVSRDGHAQGR